MESLEHHIKMGSAPSHHSFSQIFTSYSWERMGAGQETWLSPIWWCLYFGHEYLLMQWYKQKVSPFTRLFFHVHQSPKAAGGKSGNPPILRTLKRSLLLKKKGSKSSATMGGVSNPLWPRILHWYKAVFSYNWR